MTIDLANILDRFLPLKTLEMVFQSIKLSKCMGRACPQNPLEARPFSACLSSSVIIIRFYILKKSDSLSVLTWCRQETLITYYTQRSTPLKEKIGYIINKKQQISKLTFYWS